MGKKEIFQIFWCHQSEMDHVSILHIDIRAQEDYRKRRTGAQNRSWANRAVHLPIPLLSCPCTGEGTDLTGRSWEFWMRSARSKQGAAYKNLWVLGDSHVVLGGCVQRYWCCDQTSFFSVKSGLRNGWNFETCDRAGLDGLVFTSVLKICDTIIRWWLIFFYCFVVQ